MKSYFGLGSLSHLISLVKAEFGKYLPLSGGTMSGEIKMGTNKVSGLGTPTDAADAATKGYVDAHVPAKATTADKLTTARSIFGGNFDGSGNRVGKAQVYGHYVPAASRFGSYALEVREQDLDGAAHKTDDGYGPGLGFHWSGVCSGSLSMNAANQFRFLKQDGTTYANLIATYLGDARGATIGKRVNITLTTTAWSASLTQAVTVSGVSATETAQCIIPVPANASKTEYYRCQILGTAQAANQITFTAKVKPTANLTVYVVIINVA